MTLDGRSKLAKVALANGFAYGGGSSIIANDCLAEGISTQSGYLRGESLRAFKDALVAAGYGKAIKKFWTYID
jgi:hypothetical protein